MDVGFIGLGHMGAPMALNLLRAGHRVTVYNRTRGKAEALAREGAQVAERVADARQGDVLITMLSDHRAVAVVLTERAQRLHTSASASRLPCSRTRQRRMTILWDKC